MPFQNDLCFLSEKFLTPFSFKRGAIEYIPPSTAASEGECNARFKSVTASLTSLII